MTSHTVFLALPDNESLSKNLANQLGAETDAVVVRHFPDGETYVRIDTPVSGKNVIFVCGLHNPDKKVMSLLFAAATARELGARRVGLIAPYLAYMRQDKRFKFGESLSSLQFAQLLYRYVDWIATVDPHLHRWTSLSEVYPIPGAVLHSAPLLSAWIKTNVKNPILIGPDSESQQWVSEVARIADAPSLVLEKTRHGDRDVVVSVPDASMLRDRTPVLVDDIISTARTMIMAIKHLGDQRTAPPVCVGVHGIFSGNAYAELVSAGAHRIATTNTVPHESNVIDISKMIGDALAIFLQQSNNVQGEDHV